MNQPAAIRAAFAEWRMVKSRKVLQLVFEVPLETQGEVLTMLGAPMPDAEIWCGIARLASPPLAERPGVETGSSPTARARASEMGKERYRDSTPMEQARVRACRLSDDERFRAWVAQQRWNGRDGDLASEHSCILHIREHCCNSGSRSEIATDPEAYRKFLALETMFHQAIGLIPEVRS